MVNFVIVAIQSTIICFFFQVAYVEFGELSHFGWRWLYPGTALTDRKWGMGTKFPIFNPRNIVKILMLDDSDLVPMTPWYKGTESTVSSVCPRCIKRSAKF
jgi:hypothetical protein